MYLKYIEHKLRTYLIFLADNIIRIIIQATVTRTAQIYKRRERILESDCHSEVKEGECNMENFPLPRTRNRAVYTLLQRWTERISPLSLWKNYSFILPPSSPRSVIVGLFITFPLSLFVGYKVHIVVQYTEVDKRSFLLFPFRKFKWVNNPYQCT